MNLGPLRYRNFRFIWASWILAATASWVHQVVTNWLIFELTDSPFMLGLNGIFTSIPFLITSLYGGALADRMDRRKILVISQVITTLLAIIPGILTGLDIIQVWHLYILGVFNATITGFDGPARQALIPTLVPRSDLMRAVALTSAVRRSMALVGPMIGGVGISLVGVTWTYFIYAAIQGMVLICLALMRMPAVELPKAKTSMTRSIVEGFRSAYDNRVIWGILSIEVFHTFFVTYRVLLPVFARDILSVGPTGLGFLYSAPGIGALIGSALSIAMGDVKKKGLLFTISAFTMPLALVVFAFSKSMPMSLVFLTLSGLLDIVGGTVRNTMLQLSITEQMRGRVMAMNMMVHRGVGPLSNLQSGTLASFVGAPWAVAGTSIFFIFYGMFMLMRYPQIYRYQGTARSSSRSSSETDRSGRH
ncbi:MAG: MFS transporter [Deltaproteobacteria bacterium]|nr:MFS transporter [Deltaproteobacteria bacterium]